MNLKRKIFDRALIAVISVLILVITALNSKTQTSAVDLKTVCAGWPLQFIAQEIPDNSPDELFDEDALHQSQIIAFPKILWIQLLISYGVIAAFVTLCFRGMRLYLQYKLMQVRPY